MKLLTLSLSSLLFISCMNTQKEYEVNLFELQKRIQNDNEEKYSYFWRYRGSDGHYHYFTRSIAKMMSKDKCDGLYKLKKGTFNLGHPEIVYSKGNNVYLDCFTYVEGAKFDKPKYDIRIGVTPQSSPIPLVKKGKDISNRENWYLENGEKWLN